MTETSPADARTESFIALYTKCQPKLYRYLATLLPRSHDAEDVLQETAKVLWKKFDDYRPGEPFLAWAYRIAYFEALNFRQREKTRRKFFSEAVIEALAEVRLRHDDLLEAQVHALESCLRKLPDRDQQLVRQRYGSEDRLVQRSRAEGCTANALYKALQRIRRLLLQCISRTLAAEGWA
jgi:RNA polymerase sigma-70 factor (ECF subfamily)